MPAFPSHSGGGNCTDVATLFSFICLFCYTYFTLYHWKSHMFSFLFQLLLTHTTHKAYLNFPFIPLYFLYFFFFINFLGLLLTLVQRLNVFLSTQINKFQCINAKGFVKVTRVKFILGCDYDILGSKFLLFHKFSVYLFQILGQFQCIIS